jgi:hypothetical protein
MEDVHRSLVRRFDGSTAERGRKGVVVVGGGLHECGWRDRQTEIRVYSTLGILRED